METQLEKCRVSCKMEISDLPSDGEGNALFAWGRRDGGCPRSARAGSAARMPPPLLSPTWLMLQAGPGADLQQPGGRGGRHRVLVGRVDQVDGVHQDLRGRRQVPGAALPAAEVRHPASGNSGLLEVGLIQKVTAQ